MDEQLKQVLGDFLNDLDAIADEHGELGDTECRERLTDALVIGFLQPNTGRPLPSDFGMFSDEGNAAVRAALENFIDRLSVQAPHLSMNERLALLSANVVSEEGNCGDDYFAILEEGDLEG